MAGVCVSLSWGAGCTEEGVSLEPWSTEGAPTNAPSSSSPAAPAQLRSRTGLAFDASSELLEEYRRCLTAIEQAKTEPEVAGTPRLEAERARILARSKAEPVLFTQAPQFRGDVSAGVSARRRALLQTAHPDQMVRLTVRTFFDHPVRLRELLLREGYLYADESRAARFLTTELSLEMLFRESEIRLQRGSEIYTARRGLSNVFEFVDGKERGQRARLLLFDRVWLPEEERGLSPAVHLDVREFAARLGVDRIQVDHFSEAHLVAELTFGNRTVPALMHREGTELRLDCVAIDPARAAAVGRARDEAYRRALVLRALRQAILEQVREGLPFDEPRTENGQQDGKLRIRFEQAYFSGEEEYRFNGDRYQVFNEQGEPIPPQVCVDFVTETLERASGMHFAPRGQTPTKVLGTLNFDEMLSERRRSELALRAFARENPRQFELLDFPQTEWVRYEKVHAFFDFLERNKDEFRPGDIVIIRGRAAWDGYAEVHTHTFFVFEADPITGMPTLLAGNSGKPRIVTWDDEMLRAPKRSIRHRIRPDMDWLYDAMVTRPPSTGQRWASPISVTAR